MVSVPMEVFFICVAYYLSRINPFLFIVHIIFIMSRLGPDTDPEEVQRKSITKQDEKEIETETNIPRAESEEQLMG